MGCAAVNRVNSIFFPYALDAIVESSPHPGVVFPHASTLPGQSIVSWRSYGHNILVIHYREKDLTEIVTAVGAWHATCQETLDSVPEARFHPCTGEPNAGP